MPMDVKVKSTAVMLVCGHLNIAGRRDDEVGKQETDQEILFCLKASQTLERRIQRIQRIQRKGMEVDTDRGPRKSKLTACEEFLKILHIQ